MKEKETGKLVMTVDEAAKILGISRNSAYQACHSGELPMIRIIRNICPFATPGQTGSRSSPILWLSGFLTLRVSVPPWFSFSYGFTTVIPSPS